MTNLSTQPYISVIIATYNRANSLQATLAALAKQNFPPQSFEVIIVDDGSSDHTDEIATDVWPIKVNYRRQTNQGGTKAKNNGASAASGDILVFLDDDILVSPDYLSIIVEAHRQNEKAVIVGNLFEVPQNKDSVFAKITARKPNSALPGTSAATIEIPFDKCLGGFFTIKRPQFFELGMLEGVSGWPNWEDVCFGYKAYTAGFKTMLAQSAIGYHHDYAISDLATAKARWYRASNVAPELFSKWPGIQPHLHMYRDKTPIAWGQDTPSIITKKLLRQLISSQLPLGLLEKGANFLEKYYPSPALLKPLYRWILGGYMYRGYRDGFRELSSQQ